MDPRLRLYACCELLTQLARTCASFSFSFVSKPDNYIRSGHLLLLPTELGGSRPSLSSGLYVITAGETGPTQEHHFVICWPEDSTWDDSAASSVCRNSHVYEVKSCGSSFLSWSISSSYLTKICDQVVALLSVEDSASIVWGDDDDDDEPMDVDAGDDDRLFTYEVAKRNEQEENASSRAGFQVLASTLSDSKSTADSDFTKDEFTPHFELRGSCRLSREFIDLRP